MEIWDIVNNLLKNPFLLILGFNIALGVGGIIYITYDRLKLKQIVYYFSEIEKLYEPVKIDAVAPLSLHNIKRNMRFFRNAPCYRSRVGNSIIWLAKRGTGYLFKVEDTEPNKAIKLGTLWDGLKGILGDELVKGFSDEVKEKLIDPTIYITVELERGLTPTGLQPMNETDISTETNRRMAELMFQRLKQALKEDYMKVFFILGTGIALCLIAIRLGVL